MSTCNCTREDKTVAAKARAQSSIGMEQIETFTHGVRLALAKSLGIAEKKLETDALGFALRLHTAHGSSPSHYVAACGSKGNRFQVCAQGRFGNVFHEVDIACDFTAFKPGHRDTLLPITIEMRGPIKGKMELVYSLSGVVRDPQGNLIMVEDYQLEQALPEALVASSSAWCWFKCGGAAAVVCALTECAPFLGAWPVFLACLGVCLGTNVEAIVVCVGLCGGLDA